jgi:hypothetical protein
MKNMSACLVEDIADVSLTRRARTDTTHAPWFLVTTHSVRSHLAGR